MSLDAHKLAPLLQSLEALALAGSEVDDAARELVWDSLSPAARQMAQALFAARPRESAAAVVTTRPRTSCAVERFPEDVLGAIIAFVDLPMRFTCVAACSTFRDACARLSPRLEQSLVLKRFPLLATIGLTGAPAPRELFRTFADFSLGAFSSRWEAFSHAMASAASLNAHTLWLELELCEQETTLDGWHIWKARESFQIGAGALTDAEEGRYEFTVADAGLYERISQVIRNNADRTWKIKAVVVATRRNASGQLQFAEIYRDFLTNTSLTGPGTSIMQFYGYDVPKDENNIALELMTLYLSNRDEQMDPCLHIYWRSASPSTIHASWKWSLPDIWENMDGSAASTVLEHFADWR